MQSSRKRVLTAVGLICMLLGHTVAAENNIQSGTLYPSHSRLFLIDVTNGPARQFNALANVVLPADIISPVRDSHLAPVHDSHLAPTTNHAGVDSIRVIELDDKGRPVARMPIQLDLGGGKPRLWLPLTGATRAGQKRRFVLYAAGPRDVPAEHDRAAPSLRSFDALRIATDNDTIRVAGQFFETTQSSLGGAGFPTMITFAHSGQATKQFYYGDRLYDHTTKSLYLLRDDPKATATVTHRGSLHAIVEARSHYTRGGSRTKGNARATYRYEYRAGCPLIAVRAEATQDQPEQWSELHFLQLSTKGTKFPIWRAGEDLSGRFVGGKNSRTVKRWGVMSDGTNAIGLLAGGDLIWYDDPHGYCSYFQFPVPQWKTGSHRFAGWIYLGPLQPHAVMDQWSQRLAHPPKAAIRPLTALRQTRAKLAKLPDDPTAKIERRYERALYLRLLARDPATIKQSDMDRAAAMAGTFAKHRAAGKTKRSATAAKAADVRVFEAADSRFWLANQQAVFHLDLTRGGRITQILNLARGVDFIGPATIDNVPLWRLKLRCKNGKMLTADSLMAGKPTVSIAKATEVKPRGTGSAEVEIAWPPYRVPGCQGTLTVRASLRIEADEPMIHARLGIDNDLTDAGLWTVQFPVIAPLGERGRIDVAVPRGNWGILSESFGGSTGGGYPSGSWPMQYVSATSGPSTLYLGDHHPTCRHKHFGLQAGGEFKFMLDPPDMGKPGADFVMNSDIVFGPIDGDWFDAARFYRKWAHKQIWMSRGPLHRRDDMPKKLRDGLVWLLLNGGPETVVPQAVAAQEFLGVPIGIHWYCWHKIPFDDDYPHYFPTKEGVPQAVKKLKDRGIYVMPYINGRLWDIDTKDFKTVAEPACTKDVNGKPYVEVYGSGQKLVPMCPTTDVWQDKVCEIIDGLVNKVGFDAVYLDQIAAAGPRQCFDASHGHPLGGGAWWCPPYWKMMDRVQAIGAAKGPDVFFTTENNAESYSQNIDAFLVWNPRRPEMIPINALVYAGMRVHFANRVNPADSDTSFAMKVGRDFLWGTQLGWMAPFYLEPPHKNKGVYFRRLAKARMTAGKFLGYGQMLRPPEIVCEPTVTAEWFGHGKFEHTVTWPAVAGACWKAPDGHIGLIFTNYDTKTHSFTFAPSPEAVQLGGKTPAWCELTATGRKRAELATIKRPGPSRYQATIPGRSVTVIEMIPCPSRAEATKQMNALPRVERPAEQRVDTSAKPVPPTLSATLDIATSKTRAGEPVPASLTISGPRPAESAWRVRLAMPDGYAVEPAASFVLMQGAGRDRTIDLMIYPPPTAGVGDAPIGIELIRVLDSRRLQITPPRKKVTVPKTSSAITIDGKLGDWKEASRLRLDGKTGNHVKNWTGPADLSADVRLCHDDKCLFMAFDVRDDIHSQTNTGHWIWQGDSIQLAFQLDPSNRAAYATQVVEYGLTAGKTGPLRPRMEPRRPSRRQRQAGMPDRQGRQDLRGRHTTADHPPRRPTHYRFQHDRQRRRRRQHIRRLARMDPRSLRRQERRVLRPTRVRRVTDVSADGADSSHGVVTVPAVVEAARWQYTDRPEVWMNGP